MQKDALLTLGSMIVMLKGHLKISRILHEHIENLSDHTASVGTQLPSMPRW